MKGNQGIAQLFTNGTFHIDSTQIAKHLLVKDGSIIRVFMEGDPIDYPEPYEKVNMKGRSVYPGFIDTHVHLFEIGYCNKSISIDLTGCKNADALIVKVADEIKTFPKDDSLVIGTGFSLEYKGDQSEWTLDKLRGLDEATAMHRFMAIDNLGHNMIINSRAISDTGIKDKQDPPGGVIGRQTDPVTGAKIPTGLLREAAMSLAGTQLFKLVSDSSIKEGAKGLFKEWSSMGYTTIVDLMGSPAGRMLKPEICRSLEEEGNLPLRINYMYTFFSLDELDGVEAFRKNDTELVRFGGLKLFVDGAYAAGEAWTFWDNEMHGIHYVSSDADKNYNINDIVEEADHLRMNIHYHVQGNMAIKVVLDAIQKVYDAKGLNSNHTLIHMAFPTDEQITQMKKFYTRVVATVQPAFWKAEEHMEEYYGDKAKTAYPIKKLMNSGIPTGISTDYWVSPRDLCSPTAIMSVAMSGGGDPENHPPLTLEDVITGLTKGSASTTAIPRFIGMLDVGRKADMVVYDQELSAIDPKDFTKDYPPVRSTWVNGNKVYEKE